MKNIEFNLATTPFIESLSKYEEYFGFIMYENPDNPKQTFDEGDIKNLTIDLLSIAEIDCEEISVQKIDKEEEYGLTDFVRVTINCLEKIWTTSDIYYNKNKLGDFQDYKLIAVINDILQLASHSKRFFSVRNDIWNDNDGMKYSYCLNLIWTELELMKSLINQLENHDSSIDLLKSKREFYVNTSLNISLNSSVDFENLGFQLYSTIPQKKFVQKTVINSDSFTLDDFDKSLKRSGIEPFYLWMEDKQNYNFICDTLAKYLTNKTVDITQNERSITVFFEDRESLIIPRFIKKENHNLPNTIGIVASLNSLLQFYNSTTRIYFYCFDYREKEHANSYFICDLEVGNQIVELLKVHSGLIDADFSRLDLYLVYENEEISIGVSNESKKKLLGVDVPNGQKWEDLFTLFLTLDSHKSMPGTKWYKSLSELITLIGEEEYVNVIIKWLQKLLEKKHQELPDYWRTRSIEESGWVIVTNPIENNLKEASSPEWVKKVYGENYSYGSNNAIYSRNGFYFYYTLGGRILRGIIHSTAVINNKLLLAFIDEFAVKNPNECADVIHVYTQLPTNEGVPRLTRLRSKIRKKNIQTRIETALKKIGEKLKLTPDQVEEFSLSDYDLNKNHELISDLGDFKAIFKIDTYKKTSLNWIDSKGKIQVSIPAKVKNEYANDLKELKAAIKEIEAQLPIQKDRIEGFYLKNRSWTYDEWLPLYISHSLMGVIGKQLIWHFHDETRKNQGIWKEGQFVDVNENPIDWLNEKTQVQLWHPIGFNADYILSWRTYLQKNEITQPFKQAFREVYILTDAELNTHSYSNRFAGHILNREHFGALCKARNWTPNAMASGMPTKRVAAWNIMVEYWVNEVWLGQHSSFYGSAHLTTDQVRFYHNKQQINMDDVPAIIFSELMRDIDLFVGVTSIANDPNWQDRGDNNTRNYWANYAFGALSESSKIREQALKNFIPKLKIASKCSFEGKFLKVHGKIRNYKIHLGSGNILMEPNDQYLCIVPDTSKNNYTNKLYLPFEGDNMLSIIVSKATLLADDDKITDETILRQIKI